MKTLVTSSRNLWKPFQIEARYISRNWKSITKRQDNLSRQLVLTLIKIPSWNLFGITFRCLALHLLLRCFALPCLRCVALTFAALSCTALPCLAQPCVRYPLLCHPPCPDLALLPLPCPSLRCLALRCAAMTLLALLCHPLPYADLPLLMLTFPFLSCAALHLSYAAVQTVVALRYPTLRSKLQDDLSRHLTLTSPTHFIWKF